LPRASQIVFEPRKQPVQARSSASVDAILEATIQVLLQVGKEQLTTTRVAARAGVSVGTLYQYFPNKSALLQAVLKQHFAQIIEAVERTCEEQRGQPLRNMATALINAFLAAKMRQPKVSVALYAISSDIDGIRLARQVGLHFNQSIADMFATTSDPLDTDPTLVALTIQAAMAGVSRRILESPSPEKQLAPLRGELIRMACAYLDACSVHLSSANVSRILPRAL
jgi:AcrR family transcriptional regulator